MDPWRRNDLKSGGTIRDWEPDLWGLGPTQGPGSGKLADSGECKSGRGGGGCMAPADPPVLEPLVYGYRALIRQY